MSDTKAQVLLSSEKQGNTCCVGLPEADIVVHAEADIESSPTLLVRGEDLRLKEDRALCVSLL